MAYNQQPAISNHCHDDGWESSHGSFLVTQPADLITSDYPHLTLTVEVKDGRILRDLDWVTSQSRLLMILKCLWKPCLIQLVLDRGACCIAINKRQRYQDLMIRDENQLYLSNSWRVVTRLADINQANWTGTKLALPTRNLINVVEYLVPQNIGTKVAPQQVMHQMDQTRTGQNQSHDHNWIAAL